jgi:hypothetical protein
MSGEWDWLRRGSPNHQAKFTPTGELIVSPNNSNEPALKAFQAVAQVALKMEKAGEVNIFEEAQIRPFFRRTVRCYNPFAPLNGGRYLVAEIASVTAVRFGQIRRISVKKYVLAHSSDVPKGRCRNGTAAASATVTSEELTA